MSFYPWFEQLAVLERFRDFRMPSDLARLTQWQDALAQSSSVREVAKAPQFYVEHYGPLDTELAA